MYDAQRHEVEQQLRSQSGLPWEDRVFNVDTFQGREEDIIIVSLAATERLGFLKDNRRVNVMLTRCRGLGMRSVQICHFLSCFSVSAGSFLRPVPRLTAIRLSSQHFTCARPTLMTGASSGSS